MRARTCLLPSALCLLILSCARIEEPPQAGPSPQAAAPDQEAWGWRSVVSRGEVRRAVIRAGRFRRYGASRVDSLDHGVSVAFFDAAGKEASVLTSREGAVAERDRRLEAIGEVVVTASDSTVLRTDRLRWDDEKGRVFGDGAVVIRTREGVETGVGFEATPDLRQWSMRNVTTVKNR